MFLGMFFNGGLESDDQNTANDQQTTSKRPTNGQQTTSKRQTNDQQATNKRLTTNQQNDQQTTNKRPTNFEPKASAASRLIADERTSAAPPARPPLAPGDAR